MRRRALRKTVGVQKVDEQTVLVVLDHLAHRRGVRTDDQALAGHGIQERPRKNEWISEIHMGP
ncbi:hypothetical protein BH10PSE6_BH10PSE6_20420 [soil metagenome]